MTKEMAGEHTCQHPDCPLPTCPDCGQEPEWTSGETPTCGPEDWRDELVHWCRVHMGPAIHCPTAAGQPPATADSTKASPSDAGPHLWTLPCRSQAGIPGWCVAHNRRMLSGAQGCEKASTEAPTQPSLLLGQTPTFRVEHSCGCAIPMLLAWAAEPPRIGWELVCENHQPPVSLASVLITAPDAEETTLTSPKPESTSWLDWRRTAARDRPIG